MKFNIPETKKITSFLKSRSNTIGQPPGSLVFIGSKKLDRSRIRVISYNNNNLVEKEVSTIEESLSFISPDRVTWINIDGLHDTELLSEIGERFRVPNLAMEDILNTDHRPKMFEGEDLIAIILKSLLYNNDYNLEIDQVSFIIGKGFLLTFQEAAGTFFEPVRERLRQSTGKLRQKGSDYLCYSLMDALVDNYLQTLSHLGEIIEKQEDKLGDTENREILSEIYSIKKETMILRKNIRPVLEVTNMLIRSESGLIDRDSRAYFNDLNELILQAADAVEIYYTLVNDHLGIYHTNVSNGVNSVMKVLTIFASIFIPLTFITGVYGTNFPFIPEFGYRYSYFVMIGGMVIIALIMLYYFRRKKWL